LLQGLSLVTGPAWLPFEINCIMVAKHVETFTKLTLKYGHGCNHIYSEKSCTSLFEIVVWNNTVQTFHNNQLCCKTKKVSVQAELSSSFHKKIKLYNKAAWQSLNWADTQNRLQYKGQETRSTNRINQAIASTLYHFVFSHSQIMIIKWRWFKTDVEKGWILKAAYNISFKILNTVISLSLFILIAKLSYNYFSLHFTQWLFSVSVLPFTHSKLQTWIETCRLEKWDFKLAQDSI